MNGPEQVWKRGNGYIGEKSPAAARGTRLPSGHPEAFIEAFANNYRNFTDTVRSQARRGPSSIRSSATSRRSRMGFAGCCSSKP